MTPSRTLIPTDALLFTRTLTVPGVRASVYRDVQRGLLARVVRGAYVDAELWTSAFPDERHRATLRAIAALRPHSIFGGVSACLAWHRPLLGPPPRYPVTMVGPAAGGRSTASVSARVSATPFEVVEVDGLRVTPLARAVVDASRTCAPHAAVAMADHALAPVRRAEPWPASARVSRDDLLVELALGTHIGRARAAAAVGFAQGLSGSAGESFSRVLIHRFGFPAPQLQREFRDARGLIGFGEFFWEQLGIVGEFDGFGKYVREEYTDGRSIAEIVMAEKRREDRIRALGFTVVRWEWSDLEHPARLRAKLEAAGLRAGLLVLRPNIPPRN